MSFRPTFRQSDLMKEYGAAVDRESAREILAATAGEDGARLQRGRIRQAPPVRRESRSAR